MRMLDKSRNPVKGHGVCNPEIEFTPTSRTRTDGIQCIPNMGGTHAQPNYRGAAGVASSAGPTSPLYALGTTISDKGLYDAPVLGLSQERTPEPTFERVASSTFL